jgi:hypothetical protein
MNKKYLIALLLPLVLLSGCFKELDEISNINGVRIRTDIAMPILKDQIGIKEIYENFSELGLIREASDKSLSIVYSSKQQMEKQQYVNIPPFAINFGIVTNPLIAAGFNATDSLTISENGEEIINTTNGEEFKLLRIKKGSITFSIKCDFKQNTKITITYPNIKKNNVPISETLNLNYSGVSPIFLNRTVNLDNAEIDFTKNNTTFNNIAYDLKIEIKKQTANPTPMASGEELKIDKSIDIKEYAFVRGYVGKFPILSNEDNFDVDMFRNKIDGTILIGNPKIEFIIENGFGIPITAKVSSLYAKLQDSTIIPIIVDIFKDTFTLPSPTEASPFVVGKLFIDKTNSNIDDVLNSSPVRIYYKVDFFANYNNIKKDNFLYDTSSLAIGQELTIPLDLQVLDYDILQEGEFELPEKGSLSLENITLGSTATNTMPLGANIQMYFAKFSDEKITIIDSLFSNDGLYVSGSNVDQNGNMISPATTTSYGTLNKDRYNRLITDSCNYYLMRFRINTSKGTPRPFVKIYSDQKVAIKVGIEAGAKFQTN